MGFAKKDVRAGRITRKRGLRLGKKTWLRLVSCRRCRSRRRCRRCHSHDSGPCFFLTDFKEKGLEAVDVRFFLFSFLGTGQGRLRSGRKK